MADQLCQVGRLLAAHGSGDVLVLFIESHDDFAADHAAALRQEHRLGILLHVCNHRLGVHAALALEGAGQHGRVERGLHLGLLADRVLRVDRDADQRQQGRDHERREHRHVAAGSGAEAPSVAL